ncbi:MAG TPA: tetratricopeptide repeat protein [Casimicrobiaceae bacterium]|jgi:predicted O-linked N-acetylglucosamine transferase (SPINDLY family)
MAKLRDAIAFQQRGQLAQAEALCREILDRTPAHFDALHLMGVLQYQQGRYPAAAELVQSALAENPNHPGAYSNLGAVLRKLGKFDEALACYDRALLLRPGHAETLLNRGNAFQDMKRYEDALASYDRALALKPDYAEAFLNRGNTLQDLGRHEDALACFDRALSLKPEYPEAHLNRGDALQDLKRHEEALACYDRALASRPDYAKALNNRGAALRELGRHDDALLSLDRALSVNPDYLEALNNRGATLQRLLRPEDALACYDRALALKPGYAKALHNRGTALAELQRYGDAARSFAELIALDPDYDYAIGNLLGCYLHCCAWESVSSLAQRVASAVDRGGRAIVPFPFLAVSSSEASHLRCSRTYVADRYPASPEAMWQGQRYRHDRIRVAYLSADFHDNATAYLMAELFELHDQDRFEITAISFGPDTGGPMRQRLQRSLGQFVDVRAKSDREVARMLREAEIDIAVDLKGFTANSRTGILSHRPAPLQVSYLGFPGTMGAEYIDYIIADRQVIPPGHEVFYVEKVVRLPDSYQVNDSKRRIAERTPARAEAGLPGDGFVFCCFNSSYKIAPDVFDVWMRLLEGVQGSVLWLLDDNAAASLNLKHEAARRGVAADRLVFAPRLNLDEHLARHRLADLFLDTLPYNAHTTASDALWAGLPVLTCTGSAFAGRVAGSLLTAAGLPELITRSLEDYEALGLRLATTPALLPAIRVRLALRRDDCPLFDAGRFRRHIESAYGQMWERHQQGKPPAGFDLEPMPST